MVSSEHTRTRAGTQSVIDQLNQPLVYLITSWMHLLIAKMDYLTRKSTHQVLFVLSSTDWPNSTSALWSCACLDWFQNPWFIPTSFKFRAVRSHCVFLWRAIIHRSKCKQMLRFVNHLKVTDCSILTDYQLFNWAISTALDPSYRDTFRTVRQGMIICLASQVWFRSCTILVVRERYDWSTYARCVVSSELMENFVYRNRAVFTQNRVNCLKSCVSWDVQ